MIEPREFGACLLRALAAAGIAAGILLGSVGAAQAHGAEQAGEAEGGVVTIQSDPEWV